MKLLFVDDDADTRTIITLGFTIAGHEVHQASNGEEAIAAFERDTFDLVIMDLEMPVMDGWDTIHRIHPPNRIPCQHPYCDADSLLHVAP